MQTVLPAYLNDKLQAGGDLKHTVSFGSHVTQFFVLLYPLIKRGE
jgi:hypothetical protein